MPVINIPRQVPPNFPFPIGGGGRTAAPTAPTQTTGANLGGSWQDAAAANTFSAAGSTTVSTTLPSGSVGIPFRLRVSGSVSGAVALTYGNNAQIIAPVNPNAPYTEIEIPLSAFPTPLNSVSLTLTADGAGVIRAIVSFGNLL